jgi:hypothetical protein
MQGELGSSVRMVSEYRLNDRDSIPDTTKDLSSSLCVQTGFEAHPASCTMCTAGSFLGGKVWPRHDDDHSSPYSAEIKNE